jgi:hypothetical protein
MTEAIPMDEFGEPDWDKVSKQKADGGTPTARLVEPEHLAHEICADECFAYTGEGREHSAQCQHTQRRLREAYGHCVNLHDELVEALRGANNYISATNPRGARALLKEIWDVLAKVKP